MLSGRVSCNFKRNLYKHMFDATLRDEIRFADDYAARFLASIDELIARDGIDAPPATAQDLDGGPRASDPPLTDPRTLDIAANDIGTVIWATGFAFDFSWIDFPVTDDFNRSNKTDAADFANMGMIVEFLMQALVHINAHVCRSIVQRFLLKDIEV